MILEHDLVFHAEEFLAPLTLPAISAAFVIGGGMGLAMRAVTGRSFALAHLYWMLTGGFAFFIGVSIVRALEGSAAWERLMATFFLWALFALGTVIGTRGKR